MSLVSGKAGTRRRFGCSPDTLRWCRYQSRTRYRFTTFSSTQRSGLEGHVTTHAMLNPPNLGRARFSTW